MYSLNSYIAFLLISLLVLPIVSCGHVWFFPKIDEEMPGWMQIKSVKMFISNITKKDLYLLIELYESLPKRKLKYLFKIFFNSDGNLNTGDPRNKGADLLLYFLREISRNDVGKSTYAPLYPYNDVSKRFEIKNFIRINALISNSTTFLFILPLKMFNIKKLNETFVKIYVKISYEVAYPFYIGKNTNEV